MQDNTNALRFADFKEEMGGLVPMYTAPKITKQHADAYMNRASLEVSLFVDHPDLFERCKFNAHQIYDQFCDNMPEKKNKHRDFLNAVRQRYPGSEYGLESVFIIGGLRHLTPEAARNHLAMLEYIEATLDSNFVNSCYLIACIGKKDMSCILYSAVQRNKTH